MRLSKSRWPFSFSLSFLVVALAPLAPAQEKGKEKADQREKVTLQYRIAWDAFAPSKFVAVIDGFITLPLKLSWDLAKLEDQDQREAQTKQKKEFDDLIKKLEDKKINGVEFECKGEWLTKGYKLRVTTVPQPTEAGKKRIRDGGK